MGIWNNSEEGALGINSAALQVLRGVPSGVLIYRLEKPDTLVLIDANPAASELTLPDLPNFFGKTFEEVWPGAAGAGLKEAFLEVMRTGDAFHKKDDPYTDERLTGYFDTYAYRVAEDLLAVAFENHTRQLKNERDLDDSERRFQLLADASTEGVVITEGGLVCDVNRAMTELFGYNRDEFLGKEAWNFFAESERKRVAERVKKEIVGRYRSTGVTKDGTAFPMLVSPVHTDYMGRRLRVTTIRDLRFEILAGTDGLTGLKNHRIFQEALTREIERSQRSGQPLSLVIADIDHFKSINDQHGHQSGDVVLGEVAKILAKGRRMNDIVARYGGEEFAILLVDTRLEAALAVAERAREAIESHRFVLGDKSITVTASFGVACSPEHAGEGGELFRQADRALYSAKDRGRNTVESAQLH